MIRYRTQSRAPHLFIELEGTVDGEQVRHAFRDLPDALSRLPAQFVMLASYPDLLLLEADAVGPLFYFVTHIFDADPGLCVFVDGGRSPHPGLRAFIERIGLDDQVHFVETPAEADEQIQRFRNRTG
jgi:hypothetical protein